MYTFKRSSKRIRLYAIIVVSFAMGATMLSSAIGNAQLGIRVVQAKTVDNGDGHIDQIHATFNVAMTGTPQIASGPGQPGWSVDGYQINGIDFESTSTLVKLKLEPGSDFDTAATPTVHYTPGDGLKSLAGGLDPEAHNAAASDAVGPVVVDFRVSDKGTWKLFNTADNATLDNPNLIKGDAAFITFSEPATIIGNTPQLRWSALDKAIKFNNDGGGCTDGTAMPNSFNFPQPAAGASAVDPVLVPASGDEATTFEIRQVAGSVGGLQFNGVPAGCFITGDGATGMNVGVVDLATPANGVLAGDGTAPKVKPTPVDAELWRAYTIDGNNGAPDGELDAIRLTFDQRIDDASLLENLSRFQISLGGVNAVIDTSAVDTNTGQNPEADNNQIDLPFTLPAGQSWGTGDRPLVSYARPATCTSTGGNGVKAIVPTGGAYRSCLGNFTFEPYDLAGPLLLNALTLDADGDGKLDGVTGVFSEPIQSGTPAGWTMNGQAAQQFVVNTADATKAQIVFTEGTDPDTGSTPAVAYATQGNAALATKDVFGQQVAAVSTTALDGASPRITNAIVRDTNVDGAIDRAVLTFSEPLVDPSNANAFTIGGVPATEFVDGTANDDSLTLKAVVPGTEAKEIAYTGSSLADAAGNSGGAQIVLPADVVDEAQPVGTITVSPQAPLGIGDSTIAIEFSELMNTGAEPSVLLDDIEVSGGYRGDNAAVWEGLVAVAEGDCLIPTGCAVNVTATGAQDTEGLTQHASSLATEIDTIAPQAPVLGGFTATLEPGHTVPANTINMFTKTISLRGTMLAGDAANGSARILVGGTVLENAIDSTISGTDTSVSAARTFADLAELTGALPDGEYPLSLRLYDDAGNWSESADSLTVLVDTTPVTVQLLQPAGGNVVGGGETLTIGWNADGSATDFDHVVLEWSADDGATYPSVISASQPSGGTFDWAVPSTDVAEARVRAAAMDTSGNEAYGAVADAFSIDSTAPIVDVLAPKGQGAFLPAGGTSTIEWAVSDATVHRVDAPISIQYSNNGGKTWTAVNGGDYSHANDGSEAWNVPAGTGFDMRVRVTALDATDKTGADTSGRLVRGVAGYVAGSNGQVLTFGSRTGNVDESRVKAGDWVRGMAVRSDGRTGYVLRQNGSLYPFAIGSAATPSAPKTKALSGDAARGVTLRTNGSGYVVDKLGRVHAFGGAPKARTSRTFTCDCARGIALLDSGKGGYVLEAHGRLVPFAVGSNAMPKQLTTSNLFGSAKAVAFVLRSNQRSGYVLTSDGLVKGFGGVANLGDVSGTARSLILVTDTAGYVVDKSGKIRAVGAAFGDPSHAVLAGAGARGAAS